MRPLLFSVVLSLALAFLWQVSAYDSCASIGYGNATATAEVTQGPYHLDEAIFRANITDGQPGIPLRLDVIILDTSCQPVTNAFVEVWHANATGYYSGIVGQNPGGGLGSSTEENAETDFLRGMTQTDNNGVAELFTIFPGIYDGRAVHVHYGVHIITDDSGTDAQDYNQSHLSQIGQIFFEDAIVTAAAQIWPYSERERNDIVYLEDDNIYAAEGTNAIANLTLYYPDELEYGAVATVEVMVDPSVIEQFRAQGNSGMGGANGPSMGGGMGSGGDGMPPTGQMPSDALATAG